MLANISCKMRGRVCWQVLEPDNTPVAVPVTHRDGHVTIEPGGHWQNNLITNRGLDLTASYYWIWRDENAWRQYCGVGTGSAEPNVLDTTLQAEVQRTNSDGGFGSYYTWSIVGNTIVIHKFLTRVHTMTADRNLTEYGFTPTNSTSDYVIRELFRDLGGNPIALTVLTGKKLKITHELIITLPWLAESKQFDVEEYDASGGLVGTTPYTADCNLYMANLTSYIESLTIILEASWTLYNLRVYTLGASQPGVLSGGLSGGFATIATSVYDPYINGTYEVIRRVTLGEGAGNGTYYGFAFMNETAAGYKVMFTNPATFVKANTHTLSLGWKFSWGRG